MLKEVMPEIAASMTDDDHRMGYGEESLKLDFALTLIQARKAQNLTQQELAHRLGVSQAYIARLESGEANPTLSKAGRVLAYLWWRPSLENRPLVTDAAPPAPLDSVNPEAVGPRPAHPPADDADSASHIAEKTLHPVAARLKASLQIMLLAVRHPLTPMEINKKTGEVKILRE